MARIRTIKPQFWGDTEIAGMSVGARYLAIGLVSMADDDGRFIASISAISGYVFPHDDYTPKQIAKWRDEIEACGFATFYTVAGKQFGCIPNYRRHQRISKPQASPLPQPPAEGFRTQSRNDRGTIPQGNGMEWNGMEKDDGSDVLTPSVCIPKTDGVTANIGGGR